MKPLPSLWEQYSGQYQIVRGRQVGGQPGLINAVIVLNLW